MRFRIRSGRGDRARALSPGLAAGILLSISTSIAAAQSWSENGDAGSLVSTAQLTTGSGALATIVGQLSAHDDVDLYCVHLVATPPSNLPLASINCAMNAHPNLYLFDAGGMGINANMTCSGSMKQVIAPGSLAPGYYYLGVSHGSYLASANSGSIWNLSYSGPLVPNGPGAGSPLTYWVGPNSVVPPYGYQLNLNANWFGYCETATSSESVTWGALKSIFGR